MQMSDSHSCPFCSKPLTEGPLAGLYRCRNCAIDVTYKDEQEPADSPGQTGRRCMGCGLPLRRSSEFTMAWEDGDNPDGYITCADCGCKNIFES
jgi:DNA-directed RNA polymerase subunit RPC12/RpoP